MRAFVTVTHNNIKLWNGTRIDLQGDCTELNNLQKELLEVKKEVNGFVNSRGLKLNQVTISIELKHHPRR